MTHSTPITASGSTCSYTHQFKKHFGDRPVAFALSERSPSPRSSNSATVDPFAASSSSTTTSTVASSSTLPTPVQTAVDAETHNTLANLGWRIRSRINQGYTRTNSSLEDSNAKSLAWNSGGFVSERDVLSSVGNTRRAWSRVSTAPNVASNFDGLRVDAQPQHTVEPRVEVIKRSRRLSDFEAEQEEEIVEETMDASTGEGRRIAGLPKLSFSSSTSSITSSQDGSMFPTSPHHLGLSGRSFSRSHSSKISYPFAEAPPERFHDDARDEMDMDMDGDALVTGKRMDVGYDFSSHFDSTDF